MPLTTNGKSVPQVVQDSTGNALTTATVSAPSGWTAAINGDGELTVTGPPSDGVVVTITPSGGSAVTKTVPVLPDVDELGAVKDTATSAAAAASAAQATATAALPAASANLENLTDVDLTSPSTGQVLKFNGTLWVNDTDATSGGGGAGITVQDENGNVGTSITTLDFQGAGVAAAAGAAGEVVVTVPGGGGSALTVSDEGSALTTAATTLDFVGVGVTASGTGTTKTITIPGGGAAPESGSSYVVTSETTSSTTYTGLTTPQAVTITVPNSGKVRIDLSSFFSNSQINNFTLASVALSGANTLAAGAGNSPVLQIGNLPATASVDVSKSVVMTGLNPGSTTFTLQFRVTAGQGTFAYRSIIVTAA